ncbi:hypothetical protein YPPY03_0402, partial [Yersinia pestis PY-03]
MHNGAGD